MVGGLEIVSRCYTPLLHPASPASCPSRSPRQSWPRQPPTVLPSGNARLSSRSLSSIVMPDSITPSLARTINGKGRDRGRQACSRPDCCATAGTSALRWLVLPHFRPRRPGRRSKNRRPQNPWSSHRKRPVSPRKHPIDISQIRQNRAFDITPRTLYMTRLCPKIAPSSLSQ